MLLANRATARSPSSALSLRAASGGTVPPRRARGFVLAGGRRMSVSLSLSNSRAPPARTRGCSTWNIDPGPRDGTHGPSRSAAAATVSPDRLLDLVAVLDQISLHLLVGQPEVAEDPVVERLGLGQVVSAAPAQERLEHRCSQQRIAARLPRPGRRAHAGRGVAGSVRLLAGGGRMFLRSHICCTIERTLLTKM